MQEEESPVGDRMHSRTQELRESQELQEEELVSVPVGAASHSHFDLRHLFKAFCEVAPSSCVEGRFGAFLLNS